MRIAQELSRFFINSQLNYFFSYFRNCVNLLTNYRGEWTGPLIEPFNKEFIGDELKEIEYDGKNMNAPEILLDYLDHHLIKVLI